MQKSSKYFINTKCFQIVVMVQRDHGMSHSMAYVRTPTGQVQPRERGHKPTPSQESNTLSEVSCYTTVSIDSYEAGMAADNQPQVVVYTYSSNLLHLSSSGPRNLCGQCCHPDPGSRQPQSQLQCPQRQHNQAVVTGDTRDTVDNIVDNLGRVFVINDFVAVMGRWRGFQQCPDSEEPIQTYQMRLRDQRRN